MKKIPLTVIAVIILLTSFLAPIKVSGQRGGGGTVGGGGIPGTGVGSGGGGGAGGGIGSTTPPAKNPDAPIYGYKGGLTNPKPQTGGDTGTVAIAGKPLPFPDDPPKEPPVEVKPPEDVPAKKVPKLPPMPMPQECKPEVRRCINIYIYGGYGRPMYHGSCCLKLKHSVKCVCKFLKSQDPELRNGANGVLRGCHYRLRKRCPN